MDYEPTNEERVFGNYIVRDQGMLISALFGAGSRYKIRLMGEKKDLEVDQPDLDDYDELFDIEEAFKNNSLSFEEGSEIGSEIGSDEDDLDLLSPWFSPSNKYDPLRDLAGPNGEDLNSTASPEQRNIQSPSPPTSPTPPKKKYNFKIKPKTKPPPSPSPPPPPA